MPKNVREFHLILGYLLKLQLGVKVVCCTTSKIKTQRIIAFKLIQLAQ